MSSPVCSVDFSQGFEFNSECMGFYVSKLLGTIILTGAFLLKVPQIYNIVASGNVDGLSPSSFYIEVPSCTINVVYNILRGNPFTSYGETAVIAVQNLFLVLLLWAYMKPPPSVATRMGVLALFVGVTAGAYYLPSQFHYILPMASLPMLVYSRSSQIYQNFLNGSSGQLALITVFLQFGGSMARIFTTIVEVGYDLSLLTVLALSVLQNGILMSQIIYYSYILKRGAAPVTDQRKKKD